MKANAVQGIDNDLSFRIVHPCSKVAGLVRSEPNAEYALLN
ncbi:MAG TPA: hypothetical protein VME17_20225 [Bryobacteraceae bacterium]|nr:hypothetical protein [Bryobacteraceae bacterium]